jgi:plasmid stabilization system protein ParE
VKRYKILLSSAAKDDLKDVLAYTLDTWGTKQENTYKKLLFKQISSLETAPKRNRLRKELGLNTRIIPTGKHYVIYEVQSTTVTVTRVIHASRNMQNVLDAPTS